MTFAELSRRLIAHLRNRVRSGTATERGLARATGISQPHIHNVLKGKRMFSLQMADLVLFKLHLDLMDFMTKEQK
jgi:hypothetical protein